MVFTKAKGHVNPHTGELKDRWSYSYAVHFLVDKAMIAINQDVSDWVPVVTRLCVNPRQNSNKTNHSIHISKWAGLLGHLVLHIGL